MATTTGNELKQLLGLNELKYVVISRLLVFTIPIYLVWYNTHRPSMPITSNKVKSKPYTAMLYRGDRLDRAPKMTPILDIQKWNGTIKNGIFVKIDLSGNRLINDNLIESKQKENEIFYEIDLKEFTTVADWKSSVSPLTKKHYQIRKSDGKTGSFLNKVEWDADKDTLLIQFKTVPTFDKTVKGFTPTGKQKNMRRYTEELEFLDVSEFLGEPETYLEFTPSEQGRLILDLLSNGLCRVWSSDMSFYWQGMWENLDQVEGSIYPFSGTPGKGIWARRHTGGSEGIYINKHFLEIFSVLKANYADIAKKIRKQVGK